MWDFLPIQQQNSNASQGGNLPIELQNINASQ
jgi:hypothetical protein